MREYRLKSVYGLTLEEYEAMAAAQSGVCAICENPESALSNRGKPKRLAVDHNGETGKVRELLCSNCNTGIGSLLHSPRLLRRAAEYLERHVENNPEGILLK